MKGDDIRAGGKELYTTQAARTNYDVAQVVEIIPKQDLFGLLNVNKGRLDRYVKDSPELKSALARIAQVNYNAPVYKTRKVKEDVSEDGPAEQDKKTA